MSRLTRNLLLGIAAVLAVAFVAVFWMSRRPPQIARMLPEADAILYANLKPVRLATHFDRSAPARSPEFQAFVDATGIVPERDLDEVAFALTRRPDAAGPNGPVAYTEIFKGTFDPGRVSSYLARQATGREQYAGHLIYLLPAGAPGTAEPRMLRLSVLRRDVIAASNAPTAEQIHVVLDRDRAGMLSGTAPSLLAEHFPAIPALSTAWAIGALGLPFAESGHIALFGLALPLPADQPMLASLRYLGVLRLRVVALAPTPDLAMQQTGALTGLLGLVRTLTSRSGETNPQITATLNSITIAHTGDCTVISANIPVDLLRQVTQTGASTSTDGGRSRR